MRLLILCDRPGWAFDTIAQALARHAPSDLETELFHLKGNEAGLEEAVQRNDVTFAMGWSLVGTVVPRRLDRILRRPPRTVHRVVDRFGFLAPERTLVGVHAHHDWDGRRTEPGRFVVPPRALVDFLARFRGVNAVSRRLTDLFRTAGLEGIEYTANGVNVHSFRPVTSIGTKPTLRIGYAGSKKRDWQEGISAYIEPLAEIPWLHVRIASPEDGRYVPRERMPDFYNDIDVYVSVSRSEGMSLGVLEAAACGRPVITTRVGGSEDLIHDGVNGFFVDRNRKAIIAALERFHRDRDLLAKMGGESRTAVERAWSWEERAPDWFRFIREPRGAHLAQSRATA